MKNYQKQRIERKVSAGLRLLMVGLLLALHISVILLLNFVLREKAGATYLLLQAVGLTCALVVYNGYRPAAYKLVWILLILTTPVVGLILFALWGGSAKGDRELKPVPPPPETEGARRKDLQAKEKLSQEYPEWSRVARQLGKFGFPLYRNTKTQYFSLGEELFQDILLEIEEAKRFIFIEYFIISNGELLDRMLTRLYDRVAAGVEVKIIVDDFGSMMKLSEDTLEDMRSHGIQVMVFHPVLNYVNRLYFNYRDHRKIFCIDGNIAYTGGVNLADEYANLINRFGHWKDTGIRLDGAGAWGLTRQFIHMWEMMGGVVQEEKEYYMPLHYEECGGYCQPFGDGPLYRPDTPAEDAFLHLITQAKKTLYITTPYLCLDEVILKALCMAGDGGVDVCLMLPSVPDHYFTYLAGETFYGELMRHNVRIFTYTPGFLHAKSIAADREAAIIGSINMDYRSFQLHYECGVFLCGVSAVEQLCTDMENIMVVSQEVTVPQWEKRPWHRRCLGMLMKLFVPWM